MKFSLTVLTVELTTMYCHLLVIVIICISLKSNLIQRDTKGKGLSLTKTATKAIKTFLFFGIKLK